jgi:hypothetical protein
LFKICILKPNDLQQCVTNPTTIYRSKLDLVFTGGHLPSIIYNGCYYSDHMIIQLEQISKMICNLWLYTLIPKIKSYLQAKPKKLVTTKYLAKFQSPRHHNLQIKIGPCFHWRTFAINNLQWLLLLRPHDTFNSEKNSLTIKR